MKKTLFALSLGLALIASASVATAQNVANDNGAGGFVGVTAGSAHWNASGATSDRFAYGVNGGYRWSLTDSQSLGAEIGYSDFGKITSGPASLRGTGETLGANYRYSFGDGSAAGNYFVQARAGYLRYNAKASLSGFGSVTDHGNGFYTGVGVGHDFGRNFALSLNYDFHRANDVFGTGDHVKAGVTSVGAQYRF